MREKCSLGHKNQTPLFLVSSHLPEPLRQSIPRLYLCSLDGAVESDHHPAAFVEVRLQREQLVGTVNRYGDHGPLQLLLQVKCALRKRMMEMEGE